MRTFLFSLLSENEIHSENQNGKHDSGNGGYYRKHLVVVRSLGLAEEGFSSACDRAGKLFALAGLEEHENYESYRENQQNDTKNNFQHFYDLLCARLLKKSL